MSEFKIARAFVTGATGMIGSTLIRLLLEHGIEVYALVRWDSKNFSSLPVHEKLHLVKEDLSGLTRICGLPECDAFFHFGWAGTCGAARGDYQLQLRNVFYTLDAVELAARLSCAVFVGAGSQAEYGRTEEVLTPSLRAIPETGYGIGKLTAGLMSLVRCKELGIRHVWARILSVYGPYDHPYTMVMSGIRMLLAGDRPSYTKGEQLWDYLYAEDAAEALYQMALCGRDGAVYPLGSGAGRPLYEYIGLIRDAAAPGAEIGLGEVPYPPGQVMHLVADIRTLTKDTGFLPKTGFEEGIKKTVAWCRKGK